LYEIDLFERLGQYQAVQQTVTPFQNSSKGPLQRTFKANDFVVWDVIRLITAVHPLEDT
jgi:hypothetical protein